MSDKIKHIIISISFILFLLIFLVINIFKDNVEISTTERRKLALFPDLNINDLLDGNFSKKFDKYTMDQFAFREYFRKIKTSVEMNIFNKLDMNDIYLFDGFLVKQEYPLNENSIINASKKINNIINLYLNDNNRVYYSIIPDKNYFINNNNLRIDYDKLVSIINKNVSCKYINIFDTLSLEDYYYTDTHWKQENLIDTVKKISNEMGIFDKISFEYKKDVVGDFNGVLSGQLMLDSKEDKITILKNDIIDKSIVTNYETGVVGSVYNLDKLNGFDKYDVYLSGATPLLYIENPNTKSKKELVIFRDSYGSSITPLLIEAYKKITVVDTRYISSLYLKDLVDFNNSDVLFLYSIMVLNNSGTLK